ncbi:7576_t:CDS:2, partial [Racocetra fulgida]
MNFLCILAQFNNTTPYPITQDGTCGVIVNKSCGNFDCCSTNGYCGGSSDGCQEGYGYCGIIHDGLTIIDSCKREKTLALTFDDGPRPWSSQLLDELKNHSIKATFFVNGHNALDYCIYDYADIIRRIYNEGHQIAHHTWSHPHMAQVSPEEVSYQMHKLEIAFIKILGVVPRFFRPPFGEGINYEALRTYMIEQEYKYFALWDVDTNDFQVLNHDRIRTTVEELVPFNIENALNLGYSFDTVAGCNGIYNRTDWYNVVGKPQQNDSTW